MVNLNQSPINMKIPALEQQSLRYSIFISLLLSLLYAGTCQHEEQHLRVKLGHNKKKHSPERGAQVVEIPCQEAAVQPVAHVLKGGCRNHLSWLTNRLSIFSYRPSEVEPDLEWNPLQNRGSANQELPNRDADSKDTTSRLNGLPPLLPIAETKTEIRQEEASSVKEEALAKLQRALVKDTKEGSERQIQRIERQIQHIYQSIEAFREENEGISDENHQDVVAQLKVVSQEVQILVALAQAGNHEKLDKLQASIKDIKIEIGQIRKERLAQKEADLKGKGPQNLPAPAPIAFFVGREDLSKKLTHALQEKGDKPQVHLLCGPGGMGKTQLAIQLFKALKKTGQYEHVFWLRAATRATLQQDYVSIADQLGMRVDKKDPNAIRIIRNYLASKHCLYVFDDAPDSKTTRDFMPTQKGHVIMTSRNSKQGDWDQGAQTWSLKQFEEDNLVALAQKFNIKEALDKATVKYLLEELSGYPFILVQFFSLCASEGQAPAAFIKALQASQRHGVDDELALNELLEETPEQRVVYNQSMVQVLRKTLEALQNSDDGDEALGLLNCFAYLDPKGIPVAWIEQLEKNIGTRKARKALKQLEQHSLVQWDRATGQVYVHAVMQQIVRHWHLSATKGQSKGTSKLDESFRALGSPQATIKQLIHSLMAYTGPTEDRHKNAQKWIAPLSHGRMLYKNLHKENPALACQLGLHLFEASGIAHLYQESNEWALESLSIVDKYPDAFDDQYKAYTNSLVGTSFARLINYEKALIYKQKVVDMRKSIFQHQDHLEIAHAQRSVGELHSYLGRQTAARKHLQEALAMCDRLLKKDANDRAVLQLKARLLNGMGICFDKEKRYQEALPQKEASLEVNQGLYQKDEPDHPALGHSWHSVGETLIRLGKHEELTKGLSYCKRALALREKHSKENEHTANSRNWVGIALTQIGQAEQDSKKVEQGLEQSKKALKTFEQLYPNQDHPYIVPTLRNIVHSLRYLKRAVGLKKCEKRLETLQKRFNDA